MLSTFPFVYQVYDSDQAQMASERRTDCSELFDVCRLETPKRVSVSSIRWNPDNNNELAVASDKSDAVYLYDLEYTTDNIPSKVLRASNKGLFL